VAPVSVLTTLLCGTKCADSPRAASMATSVISQRFTDQGRPVLGSLDLVDLSRGAHRRLFQSGVPIERRGSTTSCVSRVSFAAARR